MNLRRQRNRRQPVYVLIVAGIVAIATLCLVPYSLTFSSKPEPSIPAFVSAQLSDGSATRRATGNPAFDVATWYATNGEEPETHGVLIETFDQSRLLASHNADQVFNPASLIKLSTSLLALKKLGANYQFQTRVFADGKVDSSGTLRGRLLILGNDPTFGDAGANLIAGELRERGIKSVSDGILVSPDFSFNFSDSAEESASRLAKSLRLGNAPTGVTTGPTGNQLFKLNSYQLRDVLLYMNARSSNFIAERIGALIGGPSGVQQFLITELKLPAEQVTIARVSGRERNRMTPRGLLTVIRALVEEAKRQGLEPEAIMPVASDDSGTLRRRLAGTGLEGAVVGKTGTLTAEVDGGMASLAGIVYTQDAGMVVFAILDQGNRIWDNRQMEDQLLAEVIKAQATPRVIASPTPRQLLPSSSLRIERN